MDAQALPFPSGRFGLVGAVNLIDCLSSPAQGIAEIARVLAPGGLSVLSTPYDWSTGATQVEGWIGGHSQRAEAQGASEPALRAVFDAAGLDILSEADDLPWRLPLHSRSTMEYRLHLLALRRRG
jgi:SAM-dependent methyltransferase